MVHREGVDTFVLSDSEFKDVKDVLGVKSAYDNVIWSLLLS